MYLLSLAAIRYIAFLPHVVEGEWAYVTTGVQQDDLAANNTRADGAWMLISLDAAFRYNGRFLSCWTQANTIKMYPQIIELPTVSWGMHTTSGLLAYQRLSK